jgi:spore maturation protein CgeB
MGGGMRVLIAYPGPTHSTYDVATGYDIALQKLGLVVDRFPYHNYLNFYTKSFEHWADTHDDYEFVMADVTRFASKHLVEAAVRFVPRVVLIVAGGLLHREAHDMIDRLGIPMVLLLTESPYLDEFQVEVMKKGHLAATTTNERRSVEWLRERAPGQRVVYLPHSYNPDVHRPMSVNGDRQSDVFFHGTLWPERKELLDSIADLPYGVLVSGYTIDTENKHKHIVDNAEMAKWYSGAKVCLNHHRRFTNGYDPDITDDQAESVGPRTYEIAACRAFQLCDDTRAELGDIFGDSVPTYSNPGDLREKIAHYLARLQNARSERGGLDKS